MNTEDFKKHCSSLRGRASKKAGDALRRVLGVLKKPGTRKAVLQVFLAVSVIALAVLMVLWVIRAIAEAAAYIFSYYGAYIFGIGCIIGLIHKWREDRGKEDEERKRRELTELNKRAASNYSYLRNFLYLVLTPHFCHLTGLSQPLTANNLTENPPFEPDADTGAVFFFFRADKENVEPLPKGTGHVANLLLSVLSQKMETTGIEGICAATSDPLCTVVSIHSVEDLGSHVRITLAFDNEAYRQFRARSGVPGPSSRSLLDHIR